MHEKKRNILLDRLCACPVIPKIYVVEGPEPCLVNEEVSLGRYLERTADSAVNAEDRMLLVGGWWSSLRRMVYTICQKAGTSG